MNEDTYSTRTEIIEDIELSDDLHLLPTPEYWTIEDFSDILFTTEV